MNCEEITSKLKEGINSENFSLIEASDNEFRQLQMVSKPVTGILITETLSSVDTS